MNIWDELDVRTGFWDQSQAMTNSLQQQNFSSKIQLLVLIGNLLSKSIFQSIFFVESNFDLGAKIYIDWWQRNEQTKPNQNILTDKLMEICRSNFL